jgi:tetraacyldisaccharide 4'-kinase
MKRQFLRPLNPLYSIATAIRNRAYDAQFLHPRTLPHPVISVGNLSTGGTGKTPLILALAKLLTEAGRQPIILSRGYGRNSQATFRVDPAGTAAQFGDEPLLLARDSGAPVYVGADRVRAGVLATRELSLGPNAIFLLDDGLQHRQLARDVNIVLLSPRDLNDRPLPAGNLREPLSSLSRADILVLREEDAALAPQFFKRFQHVTCGRPVVWIVKRSLQLDQLSLPLDRAVAFAGIAHPAEFFAALRARGVTLLGTHAFPDHHRFAFADIARILYTSQASKATALLTTEKDFLRLDTAARKSLAAALPLAAVPLHTELADASLYLKQILALCVRQS